MNVKHCSKIFQTKIYMGSNDNASIERPCMYAFALPPIPLWNPINKKPCAVG